MPCGAVRRRVRRVRPHIGMTGPSGRRVHRRVTPCGAVRRRVLPCAPCAVCRAPCAPPCGAVWRRVLPCAPCAVCRAV
eukprot:gene9406-biopygen5485